MSFRWTVVLSAGLAFAAGSATAATMTFGDVPDGSADVTLYQENGITAFSPFLVGWVNEPGFAFMSSAGFGSQIDFTLGNGGLFDASGFDFYSNGYSFAGDPPEQPPMLTVTGYLDFGVVATASFLISSVVGKAQSILLGSAFAGIDQLSITMPSYPFEFCEFDCVAIDLDNITLNAVTPAPVPLPASGAALGGAALLLAAFARRTVRRRAQ
jgi:hypothetical protein